MDRRSRLHGHRIEDEVVHSRRQHLVEDPARRARGPSRAGWSALDGGPGFTAGGVGNASFQNAAERSAKRVRDRTTDHDDLGVEQLNRWQERVGQVGCDAFDHFHGRILRQVIDRDTAGAREDMREHLTLTAQSMERFRVGRRSSPAAS